MKDKELIELEEQAKKFVDEILSGERSRFRILSDMKRNIRTLFRIHRLTEYQIFELYSHPEFVINRSVVFDIANESEEDAKEFEDAIKDFEDSTIENERTKNVIKYLHNNDGWEIARIAFEFNISRNRIQEILGIE